MSGGVDEPELVQHPGKVGFEPLFHNLAVNDAVDIDA
jgi:hypothetical protein